METPCTIKYSDKSEKKSIRNLGCDVTRQFVVYAGHLILVG